jgi:hypothetical protein
LGRSEAWAALALRELARKFGMNRLATLLTVSVALSAIASVVYFKLFDNEVSIATRKQADPVPQPVAGKGSNAQGDNNNSRQGSPEPPATQRVDVPNDETLSNKVDRLLKVDTNQARTELFVELQKCATLDAEKRQLHATPVSVAPEIYRAERLRHIDKALSECAKIRSITPNERFGILRKALDQGYPGAARAFYLAGPNGRPSDLLDRSSDLGVVEWNAQAVEFLKKSVVNGDLEAVYLLANHYQMGQAVEFDDQQAYTFEFMAYAFDCAKHGTASGAAMLRLQTQLAARLTVGQRNAAQAAVEASSASFTHCGKKE